MKQERAEKLRKGGNQSRAAAWKSTGITALQRTSVFIQNRANRTASKRTILGVFQILCPKKQDLVHFL